MQYLKFTRRLHKVSIVFNMAAQALLLLFSAPICICCLAVDAISKVFGNIFKLVHDLDTKTKASNISVCELLGEISLFNYILY